MRNLITLFFLIIIVNVSIAQQFEVPENYVLIKVEDYAPYEKDVIACVNWLQETPVNESGSIRVEVNTFLMKWLSGSPNVHVEIKPEVVTFMGTNPDLLMIFIGSWAKYSLETKEYDDKYGGSLAGIEAVIAYYKTNRKILKKDRNVEKYVKMKDKGKLEKYLKKNV